jgi:peptidoglycan L-alanyl-D-glutamate endopeptidase CwlK
MGMTYDRRNRLALDELAPNTKVKAYQLYQYALDEGIDILFHDAVRTMDEQKANLASGASQTLKSYHLVGQALDFVPIVGGKAMWSSKDYLTVDIKKFVKEAKRIGFVWGGDWTSFKDMPHLQYNYKGYDTDKVLDKALKAEVVKPVIKPVVKPKTRYPDVGTNNKAYNAIENLSKLAIINGYVDGTFKPNASVTRGEVAILIDRLYKELKG